MISAASVPASIHAVGPTGRPLSNTLLDADDAVAVTNGAHSMPGRSGSLVSETARVASGSPTRVPPPAAENTVRPSAASRPTADQYR